MRKTLLLTLILLISAAWVVAQTPQTVPPANSPGSTQPGTINDKTSTGGSSDQMGSQGTQQTGSQGSTGMGTAGSENHIEGCLGGASGNYTLTDSSGTAWQLQGDNSQLSKHVGQQVRISGTAPSSAAGTNSGSAASQTFNVTRVHKVASTCSTNSMQNK